MLKKIISSIFYTVFLGMFFCLFWAFLLPIGIGAAAGTDQGPSSIIDASEADNGRIKAAFTGTTDKNIKVSVEKNGQTYNYDLNNWGGYEYYPLQMGDGTYKVKVLENSSGSKYIVLQTFEFNVKLNSEYSPYLCPSQIVYYTDGSETVRTASSLASQGVTDLEKLAVIYDYVVENIQYDYAKAQSVSSGSISGYVPSPDEIMQTKMGICFDYTAVMGAMLRSQNIPTRLVMGYVAPQGVYHAWNEVHIKDIGWVKVGLYDFDGANWKLMDPTFDSTSNGSAAGRDIISNASNYAKKYQY